jgi:hypothetical protein
LPIARDIFPEASGGSISDYESGAPDPRASRFDGSSNGTDRRIVRGRGRT